MVKRINKYIPVDNAKKSKSNNVLRKVNLIMWLELYLYK